MPNSVREEIIKTLQAEPLFRAMSLEEAALFGARRMAERLALEAEKSLDDICYQALTAHEIRSLATSLEEKEG